MAHAQATPPKYDRRVSLSWTRGAGAEDCITQAELERRVTARLGRNPFAADAPRTLDASVKRKQAGRVAELHLRDKKGTAIGERSFESSDASCSSLEDAAVLAIALLIDPEAALAPPPSPPPPGSAAQGSGAQGQPPPVLVPVWVAVPVRTAPPPTIPHASPRPVRVAAAVPLTVSAGPLPRAAVGTGLWVDVEPVRRAHVVAALSWLPEVGTDDGDFSFSLVTGFLGGCGDVWAGWRHALGLCGGMRLGAMSAISHRLTPLEPGEQPWVETDGSIRLLLQPAGPLLVGGELAGGLVLLRPRFLVAPAERVAFHPSAATVAGTIWAGVRFP